MTTRLWPSRILTDRWAPDSVNRVKGRRAFVSTTITRFSPSILLHSTWGFTRQQQGWNVPDQLGFASKVGFPGLTGDSDATPVIQFAAADAYTAWGMQQGKVENGSQLNWTNQFTQGLTWIHGKHELKVGWDMRRLRTFGHDLAGTNGTYVFARNETANPAALATSGN